MIFDGINPTVGTTTRWHKVNFDSGRPLRIALLAGPMLPVPPVAYGGTERVAAALANKLMKRGHDVTMFASGD